MKNAIYIIVTMMFGLAIYLTSRHSAASATAAPVPAQATKARHHATTPPATAQEVLKMGPAEWRERFDQAPSTIAPQTRKAVIRVAGELQEILAAGADPKGAEVGVHVEAILRLLESHGEDLL